MLNYDTINYCTPPPPNMIKRPFSPGLDSYLSVRILLREAILVEKENTMTIYTTCTW